MAVWARKLRDSGTGIEIGQATSDTIGFYGNTPVDQPATVSDPAACAAMTATLTGVDTGTDMTAAQAATIVADLAALKTAVDGNNAAIDSLIDRLQESGFIASS